VIPPGPTPSIPAALFEAAVDAVVAGNVGELERLMDQHPELVRARSTRPHRATLLIYVGANGVEDFRQRTPPNAVDIVSLLIARGADVNAVADIYGGSTTLGLVATSVHPANAGVQRALIDLLLSHGATFEAAVAPGYTRGSIVNACLANGRGDAAAYLAARGAALDLEGACGVGRLDVVRQLVDAAGRLSSGATENQLRSGFNWACEYGRRHIIEFLLQLPFDLRTKHRETGLHWAACNAHVAIVRLLLDAGFRVDVSDDRWESTPLGWALHGWRNSSPGDAKNDYYEIVATLRSAGAEVRPEWVDDRVRADARLMSALQ
jgi:ankyrin repeat protein